MSSSLLQKNSSYKKLTSTYKNISKSKASNLLLTDFNKFPLVHSKAKTTKKNNKINHQTYSNNSIKIKNNDNTITNNNFNYLYEHIGKKIGYKLVNNNTNKIKRFDPPFNGSINNRDLKNIDILDNNMPKNANESMKCNSVNNLIGININVNYMNKNYSINKLKHNSKMSNYNNSYNIYNNNSKVIHNNINNINNNSFNEINSGNLPNSSSSKTKLNKKNIFIVNPLNQDWEKIMENLKSKKRNKSKMNINENIKSEKIIQNFIENNNINTLTEEENISSKTNIEKSSSCKNINYINTMKSKKFINSNKFINLYQNMNKKINQLTKQEKNNNYHNKLCKIINEYFIEYNKQIYDQHQKKLISEIFRHINNIIKEKEEQIINFKKENEKINKLNKALKEKNEELIKNNNTKDIKGKNESNFLTSSMSDSSSVNTEELESIRFFDKIIMKKKSFSNIPELSFKKLYKNKNDKNDIEPKKKNIIKRNSFQGNNKKNNEIKKYSMNKNNKNNTNNAKIIFHKRKINEKKEKQKPNIKSFINIFEKSRNKK